MPPLFCLLPIFLLLGCTASIFSSPRERADRIAETNGWTAERLETPSFSLQSYHRLVPAEGRPLAIYIEGDGRPWPTRHRMPIDPTPVDSLVLNLAVQHTGPVAYLARPCQYVTDQSNRGCHPKYWGDHRYAPEVIESMNAAIDLLLLRAGAKKVVMIGFSGGGAVAALIASMRQDVDGLITVAANLDLQAWISEKNLTPLTGSLNPADFSKRLEGISQVHFIGLNDHVVSPTVVNSYKAKMAEPSRTVIISLEGFDHQCCWVEQWARLLNEHTLWGRGMG